MRLVEGDEVVKTVGLFALAELTEQFADQIPLARNQRNRLYSEPHQGKTRKFSAVHGDIL